MNFRGNPLFHSYVQHKSNSIFFCQLDACGRKGFLWFVCPLYGIPLSLGTCSAYMIPGVSVSFLSHRMVHPYPWGHVQHSMYTWPQVSLFSCLSHPVVHPCPLGHVQHSICTWPQVSLSPVCPTLWYTPIPGDMFSTVYVPDPRCLFLLSVPPCGTPLSLGTCLAKYTQPQVFILHFYPSYLVECTYSCRYSQQHELWSPGTPSPSVTPYGVHIFLLAFSAAWTLVPKNPSPICHTLWYAHIPARILSSMNPSP